MKVWPIRRRFSSGSAHAGQALEELRARVHHPEIDAQVPPEGGLDLLPLVEPQQAVVDEDAGEPVAHRAVHQHRRDRASPRRPTARRSPAGRGRPARGSAAISVSTKWPGVQSGVHAADLEQEVVEDLPAPRRVRHLGMELDAEQRPFGVLERGDGAVVARGGDVDSPAAPRPRDRRGSSRPASPRPGRSRGTAGRPRPSRWPGRTRGGRRGVTLPPDEMRQELHPVAEAEHRRAQLEQRGVGGGHALAVDRVGAAREDDALRASSRGSSRPCARADGSRSRRAPRAPGAR